MTNVVPIPTQIMSLVSVKLPSVPRLRSLRAIATDKDSSGDCIQLDACESTQIFKICTRFACLLSCVTVLSQVFRCCSSESAPGWFAMTRTLDYALGTVIDTSSIPWWLPARLFFIRLCEWWPDANDLLGTAS
jgi:hypothetical protein